MKKDPMNKNNNNRYEDKRSGSWGKRICIGAASMMMAGGIMLPAASAMPVFAAVKQGTISALNIEESANISVTAYPLVQGVYEEDASGNDKLTGYEQVKIGGITLADETKPTASEISSIASFIRKGENVPDAISMTGAEVNGVYTYSAKVDPGEYIILVSGSGNLVYNPAVVSVNVTDANTVSTADPEFGSIDFTTYFEYPETAYLKSSEPDISKTVSTGDEQGKKGVTAAVGDDLSFELASMTIPYYTSQYTKVVYEISDTLEAGKFDAITDLKVEVNGSEIPVNTDADGRATYTVTPETLANSFTITFDPTFIRSHGGQDVKVTYHSKLLSAADNNFAENSNHATLTYSNDPSDSESTETVTATTYQYTFGIGTLLDAETDKANRTQTHELNKVSEEGTESTYTDVTIEDEDGGTTTTKKSKAPVEGATFALYTDRAMTGDALQTAVSDANGHVSFTGLDAGTYYLKETEAPANYTLNTQRYSITIDAVPDKDTGVLSSYTVTTKRLVDNTSGEEGAAEDAEDVQVGTAVYSCTAAIDDNEDVTNSDYKAETTPAEVLDTKIPTLPTTGGQGVYGFILAAAAMGSGLVVFEIVSRKQQRQS